MIRCRKIVRSVVLFTFEGSAVGLSVVVGPSVSRKRAKEKGFSAVETWSWKLYA